MKKCTGSAPLAWSGRSLRHNDDGQVDHVLGDWVVSAVVWDLTMSTERRAHRVVFVVSVWRVTIKMSSQSETVNVQVYRCVYDDDSSVHSRGKGRERSPLPGTRGRVSSGPKEVSLGTGSKEPRERYLRHKSFCCCHGDSQGSSHVGTGC